MNYICNIYIWRSETDKTFMYRALNRYITHSMYLLITRIQIQSYNRAITIPEHVLSS